VCLCRVLGQGRDIADPKQEDKFEKGWDQRVHVCAWILCVCVCLHAS